MVTVDVDVVVEVDVNCVFTVVATVAAAEVAAVAAAPAAAPAGASVSEEKDSWTLNIINVLVFGKPSFARGGTVAKNWYTGSDVQEPGRQTIGHEDVQTSERDASTL